MPDTTNPLMDQAKFSSLFTRRRFGRRRWSSCRCTGRRARLRSDLAVAGVAVERPGGGKLPHLVADHVLGDEHRDELLALVHREREPHHLRQHRRAARPGLDDLLRLGPLRLEHLVEEVLVDERTLLDRASHWLTLFSTTTDDELVGRLVRARLVALGRHAPRRAGMTAARAAPFATAHGVVDGVHGDAAVVRALAHPPHAAGLAPLDVGVVGVADLADG